MSPRAIAASVAKLTKPVLDKRGRAFAALVGEWAEIVGPALAPVTLPEKLSTGPASDLEPGAVLTMRVAGAAALEIQHTAPQILERINAFLGYTAVSRLKLVQAPMPLGAPPPPPAPRPLTGAEKRALKAATATVEDDGLRQALEGLGQALLAREGPIRR
jgi:hypothetical protein